MENDGNFHISSGIFTALWTLTCDRIPVYRIWKALYGNFPTKPPKNGTTKGDFALTKKIREIRNRTP